jgi:hypothetical protein
MKYMIIARLFNSIIIFSYFIFINVYLFIVKKKISFFLLIIKKIFNMF